MSPRWDLEKWPSTNLKNCSPRRSTPRHPITMVSTAKPPDPMSCALAAVLLPESRAHGCHMQKTLFPVISLNRFLGPVDDYVTTNTHVTKSQSEGDPTNGRLPPAVPDTDSLYPFCCPDSRRSPTQHLRTPHAGTARGRTQGWTRKHGVLYMAAVRARLRQ